ncbi:OsmC family protein [bacterium]|nr:OsmC family protein [bacterium]
MELVVSFPGGKRVDAELRGHIIKTDQPITGGGDNSASSPFELFLSSIGTCVGIYVLVFCQKRDIPTDDIKIIQSWEVNPQTHMISHINIEINLPATFPKQYREAVIRSAKMCAVKKHLENPPEFSIDTRIASPGL